MQGSSLVVVIVLSGAGCLFPSLDGLSGQIDATTSDGEAGAVDYRSVVLADGPVAYWRLGESSGSATVKDETGHGNTGTVVGSVTFAQPGALAGDPNTSVTFGNDAFISVGNVFDFTGGVPFSIELFLRPSSTDDGWRPVLAKGDYNGYQGGYAILTNGTVVDGSAPTDPLVFLAETAYDAGNSGEHRYTESVVTGAWTHYVVAFDGASASIYENGTLLGVSPISPVWLSSVQPFTLGGPFDTHGGGTYHGLVDEVAVYDKVLPAASITTHYRVSQGLPP